MVSSSAEQAASTSLSSLQTRIDGLLDGLYSDEENPLAGKVVSALALLGIYCVTRKAFKYSKSLVKYCLLATPNSTSLTLA